MTERVKYMPAKPELEIPMPDRPGQFMPATGIGIDTSHPYYRRLIADGDIVEVKPETDTDSKPAKKPAAESGATKQG